MFLTNKGLGRLARWVRGEERNRLKSQPLPFVCRAVGKRGVLDTTSGDQVSWDSEREPGREHAAARIPAPTAPSRDGTSRGEFWELSGREDGPQALLEKLPAYDLQEAKGCFRVFINAQGPYSIFKFLS